jgi:hypothetical protein
MPRWRSLPDEAGAGVVGVQPRYLRSGGTWTRSLLGEAFGLEGRVRDKDKTISAEEWPSDWTPPGAVVQKGVESAELVREPLGRTWARFFPRVPIGEAESYDYPEPPGGESFWRQYGEPVSDFVDAALALRRLSEAIASWDRSTNASISPFLDEHSDGLLSPVSPILRVREGRLQLSWRSASLLGALAMMYAWDVAEGREYRHCANASCGKSFTPEKRSQLYCEPNCANTAQKRRQRQRLKTQQATNRKHAVRSRGHGLRAKGAK